jgi:hypothetical protein
MPLTMDDCRTRGLLKGKKSSSGCRWKCIVYIAVAWPSTEPEFLNTLKWHRPESVSTRFPNNSVYIFNIYIYKTALLEKSTFHFSTSSKCLRILAQNLSWLVYNVLRSHTIPLSADNHRIIAPLPGGLFLGHITQNRPRKNASGLGLRSIKRRNSRNAA